MIKQVFGSFFRTIGRIIAYLAFGALLVLIFQNKDVFAIDYGYDRSEYSTYSIENWCAPVGNDNTRYFYDDFTDWSDWIELGTAYGENFDTTGCGSLISRIAFRTYGSSTYVYKAYNSYTFNFQVNFSSASYRDIFYKYYSLATIKGNTTASQTGNSSTYFENYSWSMKKDSELNAVHITIKFIPNTDLKFIRFDFWNRTLYLDETTDTVVGVYSDVLAKGRIRYVSLDVTYSESTNAVIENQTIIIQDNFNDIKEKFDDMFNILNKNNDEIKDIYTDETENADGTCNGILCNLKKVVKSVINLPQTFLTAIVDGLKALFIPSDFSFLDDFRNSIESKLGFIAEVPMAIIDFTLNLATASWDEFNSISFPEIEIFGYKFWNSQEIDLTEAINIFKPFKYITDCLCVIICARTLNKWREKFTGGGD